MGEFVKACRADDLAEGDTKSVTVGGRPLILARHGGAIHALDNLCTHDGGDLSEGKIIDGQIQCPRHGALFDLKTGDATGMPAVMGINAYDVNIENGDVLVKLKD
jgi:3-phenylpropionate/trans-cinnamate dioxygenase ferredoxin subunit